MTIHPEKIVGNQEGVGIVETTMIGIGVRIGITIMTIVTTVDEVVTGGIETGIIGMIAIIEADIMAIETVQ